MCSGDELADLLLHPVAPFLYAGASALGGALAHHAYRYTENPGLDGLTLGWFLLAAAALLGGVLRRGQVQGDA